MPFNYGDYTGLYASGGQGLKWIAIGECRGSDCYPSRPVNSREGQRGNLGYCVRHCPVSVCVWCLPVGAVPVVESPGSCCDGADSIPAACMAPPPKRRTRRSSCYERLTEPVAERTAAGGGGEVFALWGRCRTVRARCAHGACTVRARFNVFGMVAQLVPR